MARLRSIMQKYVDPETGKVIWKVEVIDLYRAADMAGEANARIDELLRDRWRIMQTQIDAAALCRDLQRDLDTVEQEIRHCNDQLELAGRPRREIPGDE